MTKHTDDWKGEHLIRTVKPDGRSQLVKHQMRGRGKDNFGHIRWGRGKITPEMQEAIAKRRAKVREMFDAGANSIEMIDAIPGMSESVLRSDLHVMGLRLRDRAKKEKR